MKPNFALSLSFEGIGLLHRRFPGWTQVDEIALDTPDLQAALSALRDKAAALDPSGLRTKLVIPNDQIKYIAIPFDAVGEMTQQDAARAALEGVTPYTVDELSFDCVETGGMLQIAAVARETLNEAEGFASENNFAPISFVAIPDRSAFKGEPFFGETRHAQSILAPGTSVTRDDNPIRIIGASKPSDAVPAAAEQTDAAPAPAVSKPDAEPEQAEPLASVADAASEPKPEPEPDVLPPAEPPAPEPTGFSSIRAQRGDVPASAPKLSTPSRLKGLITPKAKPKRKAKTKAKDALSPGIADTPPLPSPGAEISLDTPQIADAASSLRPDVAARRDAAAAGSAAATPPADKASTVTFFSGRKPRSAEATARAERRKADKPKQVAKTSKFEDEKQRMTVFGARQPQVIGGKPRFLGLILTAVLLLFLVGVAAWASIFLDEGLARIFGGPKDMQIAEVPAAEEDAGTEEPRIAVPAPAQNTDTNVDVAALQPEPQPAAEPLQPALQPEAAQDTQSTEDSTLANYAATGIWQLAPAPLEPPRASGDAERVFQVSLDPDVDLSTFQVLPRAAPRQDARPDTPANPPPANLIFEFDADGFIRATPEGAQTPQGVTVYAARPALEPPSVMTRPNAPALPLQEEPEPDAVAAAEPEAEPLDPAIAALAAFRPRARPAGLVPDVSAEAVPETETAEAEPASTPDAETAATPEAETDIAALAEQPDPALAAFRPRIRPDSVTEAAAAAREEATVDTDALEAAVALANEGTEDGAERDETLFEGATSQAVTASLTPLSRPANFAAIVASARDSAAAEPVAAAQVLAPTMPSSASVAQEATERNVLNLRKVNLIGVYGTPAARRALVRLSNGRYKKVKVGDRLDGGKVAAIGSSELRYVKGGRNVTLQMPKG